jgi:hypothetical protein
LRELLPYRGRCGRQQRKKVFFFEKKKQKTFASLSRTYPQRSSRLKVFWFFFSKKNMLSSLQEEKSNAFRKLSLGKGGCRVAEPRV